MIGQELLDEEAESLIKSYPELCDGSPSSYTFLGPNEFVYRIRNAVCHSALNVFDGKTKTTDLITACPFKTDSPAMNFVRWLIDGPFQQWKSNFILRKLKDDYYLHIKDLKSVPANVMYNFIIASRRPIELPFIYDHWENLVQNGVDPALAAIISECTNIVELSVEAVDFDNTPLSVVGINYPGHQWFTANVEYLRIKNADPNNNLFNKSYPALGSCTPADLIWNSGQFQAERNYTLIYQKTINQIIKGFNADD